MALQPSLRFLQVAGSPTAPHTLEEINFFFILIFVDYVCPFSAKISRSIESVLKPLIGPGGKFDGKVKIIIRLHPQPWHGSSTFTHEAGIAVGRVAPAAFWPYSLSLFEHQGDYFDRVVATQTPLQVRANLLKLASLHLAPDKVREMEDLLTLKGSPNGGIAVTDDLKYNIKYSRANSIHVSPTALWDGLIANEVSSSFGEKEWSEFLEKKVTV